MNIVWLLVPIALLMGLFFVVLFVWSARSGQYEDLVTPAIQILKPEKEHIDANNQPKSDF